MGTIKPQIQEASAQNSALGSSLVMIPEAVQQIAKKLEPLVGQRLRSERDESERMGAGPSVDSKQLIVAFVMGLLLRAFAAGELKVFSRPGDLTLPRDFWNLAILAQLSLGEFDLLGQRLLSLADWAQKMGSRSLADGYPWIRQDELDRWIELKHRDLSPEKTAGRVQRIARELIQIYRRNGGNMPIKAQAKRQLSEHVPDHTFRQASRAAEKELGIATLFPRGRPAKVKSVDLIG